MEVELDPSPPDGPADWLEVENAPPEAEVGTHPEPPGTLLADVIDLE